MEILNTIAASPVFVQLIDAALLALGGYIALLLKQRRGIEVSKETRDLIHGALMTGVKKALNDGATMPQAIQAGVAWAAGEGAGDTVRKAKWAYSSLEEIAKSKAFDAVKDLRK